MELKKVICIQDDLQVFSFHLTLFLCPTNFYISSLPNLPLLSIFILLSSIPTSNSISQFHLIKRTLRVSLDDKKDKRELRNGNEKSNFHISQGSQVFSLYLTLFRVPQTFTSHYFLIYLYDFSSLPPNTQFYFHFHYTLSIHPNEPLEVLASPNLCWIILSFLSIKF